MVKYTMNFNVFYISLLIFNIGVLKVSAGRLESEDNLNPSIHECGAAISRIYPRRDTINQALACMKNGFRSVYWGYDNEDEIIVSELRDFYSTLNKLTVGTNYIFYTDKGTRNALLMQKYFIEQDRLHKFMFYNPYLMGKLLGYAEDDILFFYQRGAYLTSFDQFHEKWIFEPLSKWPQDKQDAFHRFVEENKPWKIEYNQDKSAAETWLKENEHYSIEDLRGFGKNFGPSLLQQLSTSIKSVINKTVNYFSYLFTSHQK